MEVDFQKEVIQLLKDLQKQVGYLEKKIDALSGGGSSERSSKRRHDSASRTSSPHITTGGRYKSKYESVFGAGASKGGKWYEKKRGDGSSKSKKKSYKAKK